jgi:hypothetical protein
MIHPNALPKKKIHPNDFSTPPAAFLPVLRKPVPVPVHFFFQDEQVTSLCIHATSPYHS